jgi:hypothetical protein
MNCRADTPPAILTTSPSGSNWQAERLPYNGEFSLFNDVQNALFDLATALRERLAIIGNENSRRDPEAHTARLRAVSEKIDNLVAALPPPIDPQLAHFLHRKSYDKALETLEGRA